MSLSIKQPKPKPDAVDDLFSLIEVRTKAIAVMEADKATMYQKIAEASCPYKVGQIITTKAGLGQHGLAVQAIVPPKFPSKDNRWAVATFAISKGGEVTRRSVTVEESCQYYKVTGVTEFKDAV